MQGMGGRDILTLTREGRLLRTGIKSEDERKIYLFDQNYMQLKHYYWLVCMNLLPVRRGKIPSEWIRVGIHCYKQPCQ